MIHWPMHGGYNFVSGPLADMQWHPHPDHGNPVCKKHHPDGHRLLAVSDTHG